MPAHHDQPFANGRHLRACRALAGLDQQSLAAAVQVTPRALRLWEAADRMPKRNAVLSRFAETLRSQGVTITDTGCHMQTEIASTSSGLGRRK